jgi:hypothetical protein
MLKVFIGSRHQVSALVDAFKPFNKLAFADTPLPTNFESWQLFALDHTLRGSLGHLQHGSGLFESQKPEGINTLFERIDIVFHRTMAIEQRQCHCSAEDARPFLGKSGRFAC